MIKGVLIALLVGGASFTGVAQLTVSVTGVPGSGVTTWSFGGAGYSALAADGSDGAYTSTTTAGFNAIEHDAGELTADLSDNYDLAGSFPGLGEIVSLGAGATVTGSTTGEHTLTGIALDSDPGTGDDDFFWYADGAFNTGASETLEFSGSATANLDINTFGTGANAIVNAPDSFTSTGNGGLTDITFTFTAVPEPKEYAILAGVAILGFAVYRRRRVAVSAGA